MTSIVSIVLLLLYQSVSAHPTKEKEQSEYANNKVHNKAVFCQLLFDVCSKQTQVSNPTTGYQMQ